VIHVTSPVDAFKALKDEDIGVILAERKLGSMDLTHLLCLLKRQHPQIVSVVLTDTADTDLVCRLINQGQIFRLIPKPAKAGDLRIALKAALGRRKELLERPELASRYQVAALGEHADHRLREELGGTSAETGQAPDSPTLDATTGKSPSGPFARFMRQLFGG
jgi:serine/threonine-protein kinase